jgi:hypothetical protein
VQLPLVQALVVPMALAFVSMNNAAVAVADEM